MPERRVFIRGSRRFEVVVVSTAALRRRRRRMIRRLADGRALPSTIARVLGISLDDVLATLASPDPIPLKTELCNAWR